MGPLIPSVDSVSASVASRWSAGPFGNVSLASGIGLDPRGGHRTGGGLNLRVIAPRNALATKIGHRVW